MVDWKYVGAGAAGVAALAAAGWYFLGGNSDIPVVGKGKGETLGFTTPRGKYEIEIEPEAQNYFDRFVFLKESTEGRMGNRGLFEAALGVDANMDSTISAAEAKEAATKARDELTSKIRR